MSKNITIIGAGFGGLMAAQTLRKADRDVKITIVSPKAEFVYLPSLIWIPSGKRTAQDIVVPLANFMQRNDIHHVKAAVTGISNQGRIVHANDQVIDNEGLIIASGGKFIKKLPGIENAIVPCEGVGPAEQIRDKLARMDGGTLAFGFASNPKEKQAMRGGPIFEFLFGTDELLRNQGRRDKFKLIFFCPAPKPGARLGEKAVTNIMKMMKDKQIQPVIGQKIKQFTNTGVTMEHEQFDANMIVFMPGMTGNDWFAKSGLPLSPGGMIKANAYAQVESEEFPCTYVVGDAGAYPGPDWMPKQAHMAELQAKAAARNLLSELSGKPAMDKFDVELVCIIDSETKGALVYRKGNTSIMLPPMAPGHWAKRAFEKMHLRQYR